MAIILDSEKQRWLIWTASDRIWHFITNLCVSEIKSIITFLLMKRRVEVLTRSPDVQESPEPVPRVCRTNEAECTGTLQGPQTRTTKQRSAAESTHRSRSCTVKPSCLTGHKPWKEPKFRTKIKTEQSLSHFSTESSTLESQEAKPPAAEAELVTPSGCQ